MQIVLLHRFILSEKQVLIIVTLLLTIVQFYVLILIHMVILMLQKKNKDLESLCKTLKRTKLLSGEP